jgi:hypothetical protein
MLRKLLFGRSHRFSWLMKLPDGTYYQVCINCGAAYGYDWERGGGRWQPLADLRFPQISAAPQAMVMMAKQSA